MNGEIQERLLHRLGNDSTREEMEKIDTEIWNEYGRELAILISDMSGFSRITKEYGIIHFLSLIAKQHELVLPVIPGHGGRLVKAEADNLFIAFDTPEGAVRASREMHARLEEYNQDKSDTNSIIACHGLSWGLVLDFGNDMYGNPVNMASKLGEDIADPYETLITTELREACGDEIKKYEFEAKEVKISGVDLSYFRVT